jgi:hypothetical protein
VSIPATPEHPIVARFHAGAAIFADPGEAKFEKFAHGRGPRRPSHQKVIEQLDRWANSSGLRPPGLCDEKTF